MEEEWRDIKGYEGYYQVSNMGRVKSLDRYVKTNKGGKTLLKSKIMKPMERKGYMRVSLTKNNFDKTYSIHRLVGIAFIPNPDNKPQINHINGNRSDNRVENLEWCTNGENQKHAYKIGLHKVLGKGGRAKRPVKKIDIDTGKCIDIYPSLTDAARNCCGDMPNIRLCCLGKRHYAYGYKWEFMEENK